MERQVQEVINKILREKFGISDAINLDTNLVYEFGFESISFVELAALISNETGVKIAAYQAVKWTNVRSVLDSISLNEEVAATK